LAIPTVDESKIEPSLNGLVLLCFVGVAPASVGAGNWCEPVAQRLGGPCFSMVATFPLFVPWLDPGMPPQQALSSKDTSTFDLLLLVIPVVPAYTASAVGVAKMQIF